MFLSYFTSPAEEFNMGTRGPGVICTQFMKNKILEKQHLEYNKVLAAIGEILSGGNITGRQLPPIFWSNWSSNSDMELPSRTSDLPQWPRFMSMWSSVLFEGISQQHVTSCDFVLLQRCTPRLLPIVGPEPETAEPEVCCMIRAVGGEVRVTDWRLSSSPEGN